MINYHDIIILGSGPAGYTAALYATRAGRKPLILTGQEIGGQLTQTVYIDNWPGFPHMDAKALMNNMKEQVVQLGTQIITAYATQVELNQEEGHLIYTTAGFYICKALIIATGATSIPLGLPLERELTGNGISTCATCDGWFFKNQVVGVVGGGDAALEEAIYLARITQKVYLIHRRNEYRGSVILQEEMKSYPNIIEYKPYIIQSLGVDNQNHFTHVILENTENQKEEKLLLDGLFVSIGHRPNTQLFQKNPGFLDEKGYIRLTTGFGTHTNIPGVFAAGDVMDPYYRQAITSAASGCKAAKDAEGYFSQK